jgi:murein DD-endopeptidase MepM/ murein hydrolase activator NlpD
LRRIIRTLLTLTIGVSLMGSVVPGSPTGHLPSAGAATTSQLTLAIRHERSLTHRITSIRRAIDHRNQRLKRRLPARPVAPAVAGATTTGFVTQWAQHLHAVHRWQHRTHAMKHRVQRLAGQKRNRVQELARKRSTLRAWIAQWGIFETCPVRGYHEVTDNFGVMVRIPHVPVHVHQGNDILSTYGTPIVAPFAGRAVASSNELGGLAVKVYGSRGYVYNAHLERFGRLGSVQAGTVIGYVGATGDAGGPHDHFEWHPGNGAAVDPNPYLSVVC